jgi:carbon monoxide dehydrogenase subunit G
MEMQGSRELAITQQQAWEALNDPEVLKQCIPGCDKVESTGPDAYAIGMAL